MKNNMYTFLLALFAITSVHGLSAMTLEADACSTSCLDYYVGDPVRQNYCLTLQARTCPVISPVTYYGSYSPYYGGWGFGGRSYWRGGGYRGGWGRHGGHRGGVRGGRGGHRGGGRHR